MNSSLGIGFVNIEPDLDGVLRRLPIVAEINGIPYVLIEVRQDLLIKKETVLYWSNLISKILKKYRLIDY